MNGNLLGEWSPETKPYEKIIELSGLSHALVIHVFEKKCEMCVKIVYRELFAAMGAKSYALKILDTRTGAVKSIMKMKGIRFNYKCDVTPDMYLKAVHGEEYMLPQCVFKRDRNVGGVTTSDMHKVFRSTFSKRLRLEGADFLSYPFGWVSRGKREKKLLEVESSKTKRMRRKHLDVR